MKRREAIKGLAGSATLKWTTPIVLSVLLPQHAQALGVNVSLEAQMNDCNITEGRVFLGITLSNYGDEVVLIKSIVSDVNIFIVPDLPEVINPNGEINLDIEGSINDTEFTCGDPVQLSIVGELSTAPFSINITV